MNYTLIQLLLQFQMLAHLGLGTSIVAPLSEHPDPAIKISTTCKAAMKLHQVTAAQKTEICESPHGQLDEPLLVWLLLCGQPNWPFNGSGNFPYAAGTSANIPCCLPHSGNRALKSRQIPRFSVSFLEQQVSKNLPVCTG